MNEVSPSSLLLVGKVLRPHGWKGLLRVRSYAASDASFHEAGRVLVKLVSGPIREHKVISAAPHKNVLLMKLEGLESGVDAEAYRGAEIYLHKESLKREEDEYFWEELLGIDVYLDRGDHLGILSQIIPTGAHDIYVVKGGGREFMIPAVHEVIKRIDLENRRMTIVALEGLLELNEI